MLLIILILADSSTSIFTKAVQSVLTDEGFQVPSQDAKASLNTASALLTWSAEQCHQVTLDKFANSLTTRLSTCFRHTAGCSSIQLRKDKMWGAYHMLRTSKTFREDWSQFLLESVGHQASPAFFQYVTHTLFKALIEMEYPVSDAQTETPHLSCLTIYDQTVELASCTMYWVLLSRACNCGAVLDRTESF